MIYYSLPSFEKTGLVKTIYTTEHDTSWKYGEFNCLETFTTLGKEINLPTDRMIKTHQTHTSTVRIVTNKNAGEGIIRPVTMNDYDGIITNEKNLLLCTVEADCVPVYLLDPVNKVIGMIHSGWKGTANQILKNAITIMKNIFNSDSNNILVGIGPHICKNCYEVGEDLIQPFSINFQKYINTIFTKKNNEKYLLNLYEAVKLTAIECGIIEENISSADICTLHSIKDGNRFCSYRRTKSPQERMLTAIMLI